MELGRLLPVDLLSGFGGEPVVAPPIGIERAEQPLLLDHRLHPQETAQGAFLLHQEGRIDLAGGIVQGEDQIAHRARHPLVPRAILMQHHSR